MRAWNYDNGSLRLRADLPWKKQDYIEYKDNKSERAIKL